MAAPEGMKLGVEVAALPTVMVAEKPAAAVVVVFLRVEVVECRAVYAMD